MLSWAAPSGTGDTRSPTGTPPASPTQPPRPRDTRRAPRQRRPRRRSPPGPEPDAGPPRPQRRHFYRTRKLLIAAHETITDKGEAKLLGLFAAGDPHSEVRDSLAATSSRSQHRTTITMSQSNRGRDPFSSSRYESGVIQGATFLDGQRHRRSLWDDVWSVARRHRRFRLMNP